MFLSLLVGGSGSFFSSFHACFGAICCISAFIQGISSLAGEVARVLVQELDERRSSICSAFRDELAERDSKRGAASLSH